MKKQNGFTLIELVIVIIVLGILAATAVPKFINLQDDAKVSAMKGAEGAIHSAANIVFSKAALEGKEKKTKTDAAKVSDVKIAFGFPIADNDGITESVELSGFTSMVLTDKTKRIFVAEGAETKDDLCLMYTEAVTEGGHYAIFSGKLSADLTASANCITK